MSQDQEVKRNKRNLTVDDVGKIKRIQEARISPQAEKVVFTVRTMNLEKNRYESDIYLVSSLGGECNKLTDGSQSSSPIWSPDGKLIAYIQKNESKSSIWLMDDQGENKRKLTEFDLSNASLGPVSDSISWSPDGTMIGFLASLEPVEKDAKIKVINRVMYKSFFGYSDMRRRHIFVVSPLGHQSPRQLTFGDFDEHSICWSPNSREVAFISNRTGMDDFNMHTDIWAVEVRNHKIRRITETEGAEYNPLWSPDGRKIAYLARTRPNTSNESTPENTHVWVVNSDGSDAKDLTSELDRRCYTPQWTPDGKRVLFTAGDRGKTMIYSIAAGRGFIEEISGGNRIIGQLNVASKADRMVYLSNDATKPDEIYSAGLRGENERRLTNLNNFLDEICLSSPEEFTFNSFDGTGIQGWILKPKDFNPSQKHPTLLYIKGGPAGMNGYRFNSYHQLATASGYVLFHINYRGSSGYGQAFADASVGDMLGGDFQDNMSAVDYITETRSYVDVDRMGVFGGSYGGYLTNWTVTQTDRFKAAVSTSSISNLFTQWGASAIPLWVEVEIGGLPWDKMELMLKQSPIMQANKVKTPVLFLHGEKDFDTPIVEAEQMFMALKKIGVETVMVRYIDDGHGVNKKPVNNLDALRRIISWFDKHLKDIVAT